MYQHFLFKPQIDGKSNAKSSISIRFKIITNVEKKLEIGPIKENSHYSKYRPRKKARVPRRKTIRTDPLDFDFWTIRGCRISLPRDSRDGFFPASVIESAEGACARARTLAPRADPWFYTSLKSRRLCITRNPLVYSARYAAASCILTRVIYVRGP